MADTRSIQNLADEMCGPVTKQIQDAHDARDKAINAVYTSEIESKAKCAALKKALGRYVRRALGHEVCRVEIQVAHVIDHRQRPLLWSPWLELSGAFTDPDHKSHDLNWHINMTPLVMDRLDRQLAAVRKAARGYRSAMVGNYVQ